MDTSRRSFLKISTAIGGVAAAPLGLAAGTAKVSKTQGAVGHSMPPLAVTDLTELKARGSKEFTYPDNDSPCLAVWLDEPAPFGAGKDKRIVAYSLLCSHQGCPVNYDKDKKIFKCPCHFSMFDAERGGQMICGQATKKLPQIELQIDEKSGKISAIGVHGLIYGRKKNVLQS